MIIAKINSNINSYSIPSDSEHQVFAQNSNNKTDSFLKSNPNTSQNISFKGLNVLKGIKNFFIAVFGSEEQLRMIKAEKTGFYIPPASTEVEPAITKTCDELVSEEEERGIMSYFDLNVEQGRKYIDELRLSRQQSKENE